MSLMINHNMMATNATQGVSNSYASLAESSQRTVANSVAKSGDNSGDNTGDNMESRQIIRADIKSLASADPQPTAAGTDTATSSGVQGASTGAGETQASPVALEQQTGFILNTNDTDLRSIRSQGPMVARSLNLQTQRSDVMEMLSSSAQPVVKNFDDPMNGASPATISSSLSTTKPLLNHIPTAMNSVDPKVEAIRSLFNANA